MISEKGFKQLFAKTLGKNYTEAENEKAYKKAKDETLKKFPSMYKFFDFIEQRLGEYREETDLTSDQKGEKKVDD